MTKGLPRMLAWAGGRFKTGHDSLFAMPLRAWVDLDGRAAAPAYDAARW